MKTDCAYNNYNVIRLNEIQKVATFLVWPQLFVLLPAGVVIIIQALSVLVQKDLKFSVPMLTNTDTRSISKRQVFNISLLQIVISCETLWLKSLWVGVLLWIILYSAYWNYQSGSFIDCDICTWNPVGFCTFPEQYRYWGVLSKSF